MATQKVDFDVLAHDKASDKLDRISRAFRKLKNDSDNVDGDGLTDLSKKLRKVADDFEKEGNRSGKGFGRGLKKWLGSEGMPKLGRDGGTIFGSGFLGALKTPVIGPAIVGVLGAAVATALPAVGAIAGGAVVTGFGAGLAGLGIVFAAKSEAVKKAWSGTMAQLGADMRLLSRPFEGTLIRLAGAFESTVDKFNPHLDKAFRKMADPIERFANEALQAFEGLIPAIDPITDAFNAVLDSLGPALRSAIGDLSAGLSDLARSVRANPDALADMVRGIGEISRTALGFVTTLNNINGKFRDLTGGVSLVTVVMEGLRGTLAPLITTFLALEKGLDLINALSHSVDASGQSMGEAANKTVLLAQNYQKTGDAAKGIVPGTTAATVATETLATKFERQKRATDSLITNLFRLQNGFLTLSGAQISYQEAIDNATASIKENGRNVDINTAKGRANKTALDTVARAANEQTEAMLRNGKGTFAAAASAEKTRANFVRLATQMGFTVPQAKAMARQMIAIPNVSREARLKANKKDLDAKLAAAKRQLADPNLTKERRAKLNAEIARLQAAVAAAKRAIASVQGKTVFINAIVRQRGAIKAADPRIARGEGRAVGGPVKKGQPYWVGEKGPEPFIPDQNGTIIPNSKVKSGGVTPLGMGGGAQRLELVIHADSGSRYATFLAGELRRLLRANGGDVKLMQQLGL